MIARLAILLALAAIDPTRDEPLATIDPHLVAYRRCSAPEGVLTGSATDITVELATRWQTDFERLQPGITVVVDRPTGPPQAANNTGLLAFLDGQRDFAIVSRDLSDVDRMRFTAGHGHAPRRIAVAGGSWRSFGHLDPMAVVVNDANPLRALTLAQLATVLAEGALHPADWSALGVPGWRGRPVHVVGGGAWRSPDSARAQVVRERILGGNLLRRDLDTGSEANVPGAVAASPDAIGFTGLGHVAPGTHALAIRVGDRSISPSYRNVARGTYPLARTINLYIDDRRASAALRAWVRYVVSHEGQRAVALTRRFLPLTAAAARAGTREIGSPCGGSRRSAI